MSEAVTNDLIRSPLSDMLPLSVSTSGLRKFSMTSRMSRIGYANKYDRFFQFGWGPCCWILVSEIPTARLRAFNVAIGAATQWLFNFIIARSKSIKVRL